MLPNYGISVDRLLAELDITVLRRSGDERRFACPFGGHGDDLRDPACVMNVRTTQWCCHKCPPDGDGEMLGGNAITFVEQLRGLDRAAAKAYLAAEHGADFGSRDPEDPFGPVRQAARRRAAGKVVVGRKPGNSDEVLLDQARRIRDMATGVTRRELVATVEAELGYARRWSYKLVAEMLEEGTLEIEGRGKNALIRSGAPVRGRRLPFASLRNGRMHRRAADPSRAIPEDRKNAQTRFRYRRDPSRDARIDALNRDRAPGRAPPPTLKQVREHEELMATFDRLAGDRVHVPEHGLDQEAPQGTQEGAGAPPDDPPEVQLRDVLPYMAKHRDRDLPDTVIHDG